MTQWTDYFNSMPEELHLLTLKDLKYGRVMSDWFDLVLFFWLETNKIEQTIGISKTEWLKPLKGKGTDSELQIVDGKHMLDTFQRVYGSKLKLSGRDDYECIRGVFEAALTSRHTLAHKLLVMSHASALDAKKKTNEKPSAQDVVVQQIGIIGICEESISNAQRGLKFFLDKVKSEI